MARQQGRDSGCKIRSARAVWSQPGSVPSYENINACCLYLLPSPGMGTWRSQLRFHSAFLFGKLVHVVTDFYLKPIIGVKWLALILKSNFSTFLGPTVSLGGDSWKMGEGRGLSLPERIWFLDNFAPLCPFKAYLHFISLAERDYLFARTS